jgi:two-component system response regulator YesN
MYKVVLVDDEVYVRKGLKSLIDWQQMGYVICGEADNGQDALRIIQRTKPDLIITDIRMPVIDGLELINQVAEIFHSQIKFIIMSGYNDFKYAQQAIRYGVHDFILKPIDEDELTLTLRNLAVQLSKDRALMASEVKLRTENIFESLIKGVVVKDVLIEFADTLQIQRSREFYYLIIEINQRLPLGPALANDKYESEKTLLREVLSEVLMLNQPVYIFEQQPGRYRYGCIVASKQLQHFGNSMEHLIGSFRRALSKKIQHDIHIYVGLQVNQLSNLNESYKTANETMLYKFSQAANNVIFYEKVKDLALNFMDIAPHLYGLLMDRIEENEVDAIQRVLDLIFNEFQIKGMTPEAVKISIHRCVHMVISVIINMDGNEKVLTTLAAIRQWHELPITFAALKVLFSDFIMESTTVVHHLRKEKNKGGVQRIKAYIEMHFAENISLKTIANEFYMNPVYIGQLFKKKYGVYFNEFLLSIRMVEAKKLLRQTDLRIYEIAEKVGFNNADYFVTQFEKVKQMTPSEYRNKLVANNLKSGDPHEALSL